MSLFGSVVARLARMLYPNGSVRRVLRGPARGARFVVAPGIGVTYSLGTRDATSPGLMALVRERATVYDVGANQGQMALAFARLVGPGGRVRSFEPAPGMVEMLERNLALSAARNVSVEKVAVSDEVGSATFLFDPANPTQGKLRDVEESYTSEGAPITVPLVTLDSIAANGERPDVIKIDVEGAGAQVLRGAAALIALPPGSAPVIYIELHGPEEQAGVRDCLIAAGYEARTLEGRLIPDPVAEWATPLICRKLSK